MGDLEPVILGIVSKLSTTAGDATLAKQNTIIADIVAARAVLDETNGYLEGGGDIHDVLYADAAGASIAVDIATVIANIGTVDGKVDAVKSKSDLLNSASGSSTLNDANPSDTIVPSSLPCKMHVTFDISNLNTVDDDFTLEVKVGAAANERVVAYYKLTSDGSDITADTGSGIGNKTKVRRIDISSILCFTGEQVLLDYTKSSVTDRNVVYKYVCSV